MQRITGREGTTLDGLIEHCREQTALFLRFQPCDNSSCYQVCRFAFEARNEQAWEAFYDIYTPLVQQWLKRHTISRPEINFDDVELVQGTFTRIFRAIPPDKFSKFPTLPSLLEYLKLCCRTEVMNTLRLFYKTRSFSSLRVLENESDDNFNLNNQVGENLIGGDSGDNTGAEQVDRERLWKLLCKILKSKKERLAILSQYFEGMAPREILQAYPEAFTDIEDLRYVLRNAKYKLRNSTELKEWLDSFRK